MSQGIFTKIQENNMFIFQNRFTMDRIYELHFRSEVNWSLQTIQKRRLIESTGIKKYLTIVNFKMFVKSGILLL